MWQTVNYAIRVVWGLECRVDGPGLWFGYRGLWVYGFRGLGFEVWLWVWVKGLGVQSFRLSKTMDMIAKFRFQGLGTLKP